MKHDQITLLAQALNRGDGRIDVVDLNTKVPSNLVRAAGEHYVLSQLLLQGFNAGLAPVRSDAHRG